MTTKREIERWVAPIVSSRSDVALAGRALMLCPIHHLACGLQFRSTGTRTRPELLWFIDILFVAPGSWNACFEHQSGVGNSSQSDFPSALDRAMRDGLEQYLGPMASIEAFHDLAVGAQRRFTFLGLDCYGLEHGTVLAALGRLDDAKVVLRAAIADAEARAAAEQRAETEHRLTRPTPRGVIILDVWRRKMKVVELVKELLAQVESGDRSAIAALLHDWEHVAVTRRQIEHLWESTPFPLEQRGETNRW
jgi:hypothetical protein